MLAIVTFRFSTDKAGSNMKSISTDRSPKPGGHYSQAVEHNGVIYIAGQLPFDPESGEKVLGSIEDQTKQVLSNLEAILIEAGSDRDHVLKTTAYISDINLWGAVNKIYETFFANHKPARAVVPVLPLHHGFLIEIDAVAAVK